jgi:hypothetical protein
VQSSTDAGKKQVDTLHHKFRRNHKQSLKQSTIESEQATKIHTCVAYMSRVFRLQLQSSLDKYESGPLVVSNHKEMHQHDTTITFSEFSFR